MDVVTDGGTIVGIIVFRLSNCLFAAMAGRVLTGSEHFDVFAAVGGNLRKQGEQVEGDSERVLAHDSRRVCAGGIEVAQQSSVPAGVCFAVIADDCGRVRIQSVATSGASYPAQSSSWSVRTGW